ncbi:MAG: CRISPR-associated endonuclease Cas2 [Thermus sp.]|uniref:CRISPR-associated endonuclease Cas2 n=1 Tax=Thermus sp. TaxID=275 RepID=UPI0033294363
MGRKKLYAIAYDIPDNNRRVKVANLLKSYGERVQLSVFECYLDEELLSDLKTRAQKLLNLQEDSLRIYPVGPRLEVLGQGLAYEEREFFVA